MMVYGIDIIKNKLNKQLNMTQITKNFSLAEFTASDTATKENIDNRLPDNGEDLNIKHLCVYLLQPLRDKFGSMTINSGYRCQALNKAVGGAKTSQHLTGKAADVIFNKAKLIDVWNYLNDNPDNLKWRQCILYRKNNFIHFNYDQTDNKMEMIVKN